MSLSGYTEREIINKEIKTLFSRPFVYGTGKYEDHLLDYYYGKNSAIESHYIYI